VLNQQYNSILFRETFPAEDEIDSLVLIILIFNPRIYTTWGKNFKK